MIPQKSTLESAIKWIKCGKNIVIVTADLGRFVGGAEALVRCQKYGVDGVLIGRAAFGDPWIFAQQTPIDNAIVALEHARLFEETYGASPRYSFLPMRKHLAWYIRGMPQAREIRSKLVRANTSEEVCTIFVEFGLPTSADSSTPSAPITEPAVN